MDTEKKRMEIDRECVETETEIIVLGQPDTDDEEHNCDCMGCSSVSHVLYRFRKTDSYQF
jgi:hypothetical protein